MKLEDLFVENKKEITALSKLKLPITKKLEKLLLSKPTSGYTEYYSIVQLWRGKIIQRVFATRLRCKKPQYQEVIRRIEGNSEVLVRNMYFVKIAGYKTVWDEKSNTYYFSDSDFNLWWTSQHKYFKVYNEPLYTLEDLATLDPSLKYCGYSGTNIIDWITIYRKYPEIEMLAKLKMENLALNIRILEKLKDRKFKKYLCKQTKGSVINSTDVLYGFKNNLKFEQAYVERETKKYVKAVMRKYSVLNEKKLYGYFYKHLESKGYFLNTQSYIDMLEAEEYLHLDLTLDKNAFPYDFDYWHDYYINQMRISKNKKTDENIKKQVEKYHKLEKEINGLEIVLATSTEDMINAGQQLHNCVGRMSYNTLMAKGDSLILFVKKANDLLYCMEWLPKGRKINQLYGDYNSLPAKEDEEIIKNIWLPKVQRLKIA